MTFYHREIKRIRENCYGNGAQIEMVVAVRHFIANNCGQALNLDMLSRIRFTSKFHLLRIFKKYYGQTPMNYLVSCRIEQSKLYLKEGRTVSETCYAIGMESPSSFSTLFKRKTGLAPAEFQKVNFHKVHLSGIRELRGHNKDQRI